MTTEPTTTPVAATAAPASAVDAATRRRPPLMRRREVAELTALRDYPGVSVLMPTTPTERMTEEDAATLAGLVEQVSEQLGTADGLVGARQLRVELRAITAGLSQESDPELVHDLVDDLIEIVIQRGGEVALVRDGHLTRHYRVALVTHPRP